MIAWRLVKRRHVANAFDGEGARLYGGRWNLRGDAAVYLSGSLSLAALELFVHLLPEDASLPLAAMRVEIPEWLRIDELAVDELPADWRAEPGPIACRKLGSQWLGSSFSGKGNGALLRVPSVIVPHEYNYLLNPAHAGLDDLIVHAPVPFGFDARMWK